MRAESSFVKNIHSDSFLKYINMPDMPNRVDSSIVHKLFNNIGSNDR